MMNRTYRNPTVDIVEINNDLLTESFITDFDDGDLGVKDQW